MRRLRNSVNGAAVASTAASTIAPSDAPLRTTTILLRFTVVVVVVLVGMGEMVCSYTVSSPTTQIHRRSRGQLLQQHNRRHHRSSHPVCGRSITATNNFVRRKTTSSSGISRMVLTSSSTENDVLQAVSSFYSSRPSSLYQTMNSSSSSSMTLDDDEDFIFEDLSGSPNNGVDEEDRIHALTTTRNSNKNNNNNKYKNKDMQGKDGVRRKYKRKRIPETEKELRTLRQQRQAEYEQIVETATANGESRPSIWSFESLFPKPVCDIEMVQRDLYEVKQRDGKTQERKCKEEFKLKHKVTLRGGSVPAASSASGSSSSSAAATSKAAALEKEFLKMKSSYYGGDSMMRIWREPRLSSPVTPTLFNEPSTAKRNTPPPVVAASSTTTSAETQSVPIKPVETTTTTPVTKQTSTPENRETGNVGEKTAFPNLSRILTTMTTSPNTNAAGNKLNITGKVNRDMTRMVEDRMFGYRRNPTGTFEYDTSLMGDGAVQFRDGVRLGNPLKINADRLNFLAKKELQHGRVEEAQELYEQAIRIDPRDGRAYLGLSKCAERRHDFTLARDCLKAGIRNTAAPAVASTSTSAAAGSATGVASPPPPDRGPNPFLLQALGCLEEKTGNLAQAEALYISAARSRPYHAAAWVSLAKLRTEKLGQSAMAGRACFQAAEREIQKYGAPPSAHVYTAWAALEFKKAGDTKRARELFKAALEIDPKCSAAWLQLGVMEMESQNWKEAEKCFETVLKFDQRNTRVLQAYALMEIKRPDGSNSRKAIDLFERALKTNPRDAGVLQPYALYVADLGDFESARALLRRGTEANKRHAPVWQAWGVLETRLGNTDEARKIFQEGIWACAQLGGGQSGGYKCARLWQAWGVLEAREGDHAAARRCFSRALDADSRNVATYTAWAIMEEGVGNEVDARFIYEEAVKKFSAGSDEKAVIWRNYELMEQRLGHVEAAQQVYNRAMREAMAKTDENFMGGSSDGAASNNHTATRKNIPSPQPEINGVLKASEQEVEVIRWKGSIGSMSGDVWLNEDGSIEGKVPRSRKKPKLNKKQQ